MLYVLLFLSFGVGAWDGFPDDESQISELKVVIAQLREELASCREGLWAGRRNQDTEETMWWTLESGDCLLEDGCLSSPSFPQEPPYLSRCVVHINPAWTGFLDEVSMERGSWYSFVIDGEVVSFVAGSTFDWSPLHNMAPRRTLASRVGGSAWKLCQMESPWDSQPPWSVTSGSCVLDKRHCFLSPYFNPRDLTCYDSVECSVSIRDDWQGAVEVQAEWSEEAQVYMTLEVNNQKYAMQSSNDLVEAGLQGVVASGTMRFQLSAPDSDCGGLKICPMAPPDLPGPWGDKPWTCTVFGDDCTLPFVFKGVSSSACTQQFSDPYDADGDGSQHNGHPQCESATGLSLCGPCSCSAGEEQTYNMTSVYPHTNVVGLVTCAPCAAGRFKDFSGSDAPDSCEMCPPGTSSSSGETACETCSPGTFKDFEMLECASCQPGHFGSGSGRTTCQQCAADSYASERQTACASCPQGSFLIAQTVGCQHCSPGTFRDASMTSCSPCEAGSYQHTAGQPWCYQCSAVLDPEGPNPQLWTTMSRMKNGEWQETSGSQSVSDCGCSAGAWIDALGQCRECGAGIACKGMGEVEVLPGYFASIDSAGFVWRCHGADWARCPGGKPGQCAQRRLNTSIACEACEPYTRRTNDGPCKACAGPDVAVLVAAVIFVVAVLWCVYCSVARDNQAKKMDSFVFASIVCSQFVTLLQMLGVLKTLSVAWPEPFATIVELGALTNFRLEILNVGCVVSSPPLHLYVANAFAFVALILGMVACHILHVAVFHFASLRRLHLRQFTPALFGAVCTVFMAVYISVCSAIVQPLQCELHPNGLSTMQTYREVICWDPEGEHQNMMIIAALASLLPLGFFSLCAWVIYSLPQRLHAGDTVFLNTYAFLLFRFRPGAQSYVLVLLLRNFVLAVVPVIPDLATELFASACLVMACVLVGVSMSPWAVQEANHLDVAMHTGLVLVLLLAALQTTGVDEMAVGNFLLVVFSGTMCAFLVALVWSLHLCARRLRKPFRFFLCHHKVGAGAFCRLLKMRLLSHRQVECGVFLDSDNLEDLSLLFGIVGEKTETLVVLCSREILHRPWCVGEMTTARLQRVDTVLVLFSDFEHPSRMFIESYASVEGIQSLAPYGISVEMAQQTLWWLGTRPWIVLPRSMSSTGADAVVDKLVVRGSGKLEMAPVSSVRSVINSSDREEGADHEEAASRWRAEETVSHLVAEPGGWSTPASVAVVSIVDHTNQESVCTALLVKELLKRFCPLTGAGHVLGPDEKVPTNATLLLVMSSNGCFQKPNFVYQLFQAEALGIGAIPIILGDGFLFPSDAFFHELRALSSHILSGTHRHADDLIALIKKLFEEIGINVCPQDSQGVLEVRAEAIARRFSAPRAPLTCKRVAQARDPSRSDDAGDTFFLEIVDDTMSQVDAMFEQNLFDLEVADEGEILLPL